MPSILMVAFTMQYRCLEIMTREREQQMIAAAQKQALAKLGPEQMHQLNSLPEVGLLSFGSCTDCADAPSM